MGGDGRGFGDLFDVMFKGEVAVKHDSEVADVRGGRQSGVVDVEGEVVTCFSEGFGTDDDHVSFITVEFQKIGLHP